MNGMDEDLSFAIGLAKQAGEQLRNQFHSDTLRIHFKTDQSLVTEADIAADELIRSALQERYPDDMLLSEELAPQTGELQDIQNRFIWVIDPLDGTTNFNLGLQCWGVSLARLKHGVPVLAVVHFPLLEETYCALKDEGATLNGQPLKIQPDKFRKIAYFACCSRTHQRYQVEIPYKTRILGCASYTYCAVARSAAAVGFEVTPKVWDLAGAWLVLEEAGGVIAPIEGETPFPVKPGIDYTARCYPTLASFSVERLEWARLRIRPKPTKLLTDS